MRLRPLTSAGLMALALSTVTLSAAVSLSTATAAAATPPPNAGYGSIVSQFMCVSCHEPLELVSSPQALSEKAQLQQYVNQGMTFAQIKRAMVAQYGIAVLARPPAHGFNLTVYILPPVILIGGLALLAFTLPRWRARARRAAATPLEGVAPLPPRDAARLDDELDRFV